ncbi:MAG: hypothetical protein ABW217_14105 [Polyangiaceae bacterium]
MVGKSRGARALLMGLSIVLTRLAVAQDAGVSLADAAIPDAASAEGEVPDTPTCVDDAFEPNQSVAQATPLAPGVHVDAVVCAGDPDLYRFTPPVPAGSLFLVTVDFTHALGDIDARLISLGSGATVALSESVNDDEQLVARADGGDYALLVTLFSGTGNAYGVDVSAVVNDATNECCSTSPGPGCNDLAVSECVCLTDVRCCSGSYDEVCVLQAAAECGAACALPPPTSDCCSAASDPGNSPGCAVPAVEACVCAIDPFCCGGRFDQSCANLARVTCGASCPEGR